MNRQKNDSGGGTGPANSAGSFETIDIRHSDIQGHYVRLEIEDGPHTFQPTGSSTGHLKFPLQHVHESAQSGRVVVDQEDACAMT